MSAEKQAMKNKRSSFELFIELSRGSHGICIAFVEKMGT